MLIAAAITANGVFPSEAQESTCRGDAALIISQAAPSAVSLTLAYANEAPSIAAVRLVNSFRNLQAAADALEERFSLLSGRTRTQFRNALEQGRDADASTVLIEELASQATGAGTMSARATIAGNLVNLRFTCVWTPLARMVRSTP